jgi:hypothetical protein
MLPHRGTKKKPALWMKSSLAAFRVGLVMVTLRSVVWMPQLERSRPVRALLSWKLEIAYDTTRLSVRRLRYFLTKSTAQTAE